MGETIRVEVEVPAPCTTCKGAGTVWAPKWTLPRGFLVFCGSALPKSEDGGAVEIICPDCDGRAVLAHYERGGG